MGNLRKTCHSHLKFAPADVLYRNISRKISGVAEKNNRRNFELPVAYEAGLHKLESGEGCIAPKKTAAGRRGIFRLGGGGGVEAHSLLIIL
jgi:hypothetical protein